MLKEINLNDPTTRALYDLYPEDKKEEFQDAYVYMKYFIQNLSTIRATLWPQQPQSKEAMKLLEDTSQEVKEHLKITLREEPSKYGRLNLSGLR